MQQQFSSTLLEKAVAEFSKLPGIGRKTALRLVLFMLKRKSEDVELFADTISRMRREVKYCRVCHNISDTDVCPICSDSRRDASTICVVENVQDDLELVAVISAAIAAATGTSADGFVVRSVRKVNRRKWS